MFSVRKAAKEDLNSIVTVHHDAFKGFFLTKLGRPFLYTLYDAFMNDKCALLLVVINKNEEIVGFLAGTYTPELFFYNLKRNKWFRLFINSIQGIIRHPYIVIRKLFFSIFYTGDKPEGIKDSALLSSIAVHPKYLKKSLGKLLICHFEKEVKSKSIENIYLTTDKLNNDAVLNFYSNLGYEVYNEFKQPDGRKMLCLIKNFNNKEDSL